MPSPLSTKVTPVGSAALGSAGVGNPVVVTVNVPNVPGERRAAALVIVGTWAVATVSMKLWVASGTTPLAAVIVSG